MLETILIIDWGSPHAQIVARQLRVAKIYSEVNSFRSILPSNNNIKGVVSLVEEGGLERVKESLQTPLPSSLAELPHLLVEQSSEEMSHFINEEGLQPIVQFALEECGVKGNWTPQLFIDQAVESIRKEVKNDSVILGLSGGVDSTVAAVLLQKAIGNQLNSIFIDNGLLRKGEFEKVLHSYREMGLNVKGVDASHLFLEALEGVSDPEEKRKAIGHTFIEVFDQEASKIEGARWLAQGTIYPDVIESGSAGEEGSTIKSHHNVGGLPEKMNLKVIEPLRMLFKDEVRRVGNALKIDPKLINRHPFPGPGLGIRILGEVTKEKLSILKEADAIYIDGLYQEGLYDKVWQAATILLPLRTVGVKDGKRTYQYTVALRAVLSTDGMSAHWVHLPHPFLEMISSKILNEVEGVNRVVYDISSKPPATIEWE